MLKLEKLLRLSFSYYQMSIIKLIIIFQLLILTSCATTPIQKHYFQQDKRKPPVGYTILYIYNPYNGKETYDGKTMSGEYSPPIFIDGQEIAVLPYQTYTAILMPPGPHIGGIFRYDYDQIFFTKPKPKYLTTFFIGSKKKYYLQYSMELDEKSVTSYNLATGTPIPSVIIVPTNLKFNLFDNLSQAKEITRCRYVDPKIEKLEAPIK